MPNTFDTEPNAFGRIGPVVANAASNTGTFWILAHAGVDVFSAPGAFLQAIPTPRNAVAISYMCL
jgi:hypothetical protein